MAKKKQMHAKKAATSKKEGSLGWVIAAIIVIAVIAFLVLKPGKEAMTQTPTQATTPEKGTLTTSEAPQMATKCLNAIGIVPGTKVVANNVVTVTFKNNGRTGIEGSYFEFADKAGKKVYKKNSDAVESAAEVSYSVDLNQVSSELGSEVKSFVILPVEGGLACQNQRSVVIKYE